MMRYSFWHGRNYTVGDLAWLVQAFKLLKDDAWKPEAPVYFDGSGWESSVREAAAVSLLNALAVNATARTLFLQNAELDLKAQLALTGVFERNAALRSVSLKNLRCGDAPMVLPEALFTKTDWTDVSLAQCALDERGCALLARLMARSRSLQSLSLTKMALPEAGIDALCDGLKRSRSLRSLTLRALDLPVEARSRLLRAVAANASLTSLLLEDLALGDADAPAVARLLARNASLTSVSLRRNALRGAAVRRIVDDGLMANRTLRTLKLCDNRVGDDGARHLADRLQRQTTLRSLCLGKAGISRAGCRAFCRSLETMHGLRHVALDGNEMDRSAADLLLRAVQRNVFIQSVSNEFGFFVEDAKLWRKIETYLMMNKANRRIIREENLSRAVLARVIGAGSSQADLVFELLRELPACTMHA